MTNTYTLVHFTFNKERESDPFQAFKLFLECFPEINNTSILAAANSSRGVRITCTSDQFVYWLYRRDQAGFVNRVRQLGMTISECETTSSRTSRYQTMPQGSTMIKPMYFQTEAARIIRGN